MTTRAEQVEACAAAMCEHCCDSRCETFGVSYAPVRWSALTLTRDGLILEKLHALIARLSTGSDRSKEIAEELRAIVGDAR